MEVTTEATTEINVYNLLDTIICSCPIHPFMQNSMLLIFVLPDLLFLFTMTRIIMLKGNDNTGDDLIITDMGCGLSILKW